MFNIKQLITLICLLNITYCDWVQDWMAPVQEQLKRTAARKMLEEEATRMMRVETESMEKRASVVVTPSPDGNFNLKTKLEATLANAEDLIDKLQMEIFAFESKERRIKDAIANGRTGISAVTVSTLNQNPRFYLVREGAWSLCNGMIQHPSKTSSNQNIAYGIFDEPRCIGAEMSVTQDPCVFNSVIKYEVVPEKRSIEYVEEDMFCLKPMFNKSLENYHSVPKRVVSDTCLNGLVRNLQDHEQQCSTRTLSEYTYYPKRSVAATVYPLEYCQEKDGSCKMIVAWHVSNTTVENFEFLKSDNNFKKYFITTNKSPRQMLLDL